MEYFCTAARPSIVNANVTEDVAPIGMETRAPLEDDPSKMDDLIAPIDEGVPSLRYAAQ